MWPYATRGARQADLNVQAGKALSEAELHRFRTNDVWIKVWIPERLEAELAQMSAGTNASRPDVLRALFFEHVYGKAALQQFQNSRPEVPTARFSRQRTAATALLGKATVDIKLWMPEPLKDELARLALSRSMRVSDYCRMVLVGALLGMRVLLAWETIVRIVPAAMRAEEER